jgi:16S rRNA (guanine(966)-N(2))-methyltransferase RsmD
MRPTTSKVKLALTSMLGNDLISGSKVLDLFAGTGSVGIELFKLGANKVMMIEKERNLFLKIKEVIKPFNTDDLEITKGDVFSIIPKIKEKYDIIFADPPYKDDLLEKLISTIEESNIASNNCILIYEHYKKVDTPDNYLKFKKLRDRTYGDSRLSIYKKNFELQS